VQAETIFDLAAALERIDGDRDLFITLADLFILQAAADMAAIREAFTQGDAEQLMKQAHRLKGSVMQFHATALYDATSRLEHLGRQGAIGEAAAAVQTVESELTRFMNVLRELIEKGLPS
jgi:histidine phosphotransfer protein HptB